MENWPYSQPLSKLTAFHQAVIKDLYHGQHDHGAHCGHAYSSASRLALMHTLPFPATLPAQDAPPSNVAYLKPSIVAAGPEGAAGELHDIIHGSKLSALFQPIIHMHSGDIIGYEGLIRGPSDSPLHAPMNLFKVARAHDLTLEVEHLCRQVVLERFAELQLPGKLFLNVSPECLLLRNARNGETLEYIEHIGINPDRVIIELT